MEQLGANNFEYEITTNIGDNDLVIGLLRSTIKRLVIMCEKSGIDFYVNRKLDSKLEINIFPKIKNESEMEVAVDFGKDGCDIGTATCPLINFTIQYEQEDNNYLRRDFN